MNNSDITNRLKEMIFEEFQNPYPQDIFSWDNKEKITLTKGRFNEFIHSVVENTKKDIIKIIDECG